MNKSIFLASAIASILALPAFADDPATITGSSQCNVTNLGTSDNNSTANVEAVWSPISYTCPAGQYLEADNVTCTTCPTGSYCAGFQSTQFADADIGVNACPTGYTNSAAGTSSQNDCYNPSTVTCSTCNPYSGANSNKVTNVTYGNSNNGSAACKTYYGDQTTCVLDVASACDITDITCATGYHKASVSTGGGNSGPLSSLDTTINGTSYHAKGEYNNADYCLDENGSTECNTSPFTSMSYNDWDVTFSYGTVKGIASCNNTPNAAAMAIYENFESQSAEIGAQVEAGTMTDEEAEAAMAELGETAMAQLYGPNGVAIDSSSNFSSDSQGQYCWCKTTNYTPNGGSTVSASSSWVFADDLGSASNCAAGCADNCANDVLYNRGFRGALFGANGGGATSLQCVANTINIDWYSDNVKLTVSDEAKQCTYDQTITLPTAPEKTGYTFNGWTLKPAQNN